MKSPFLDGWHHRDLGKGSHSQARCLDPSLRLPIELGHHVARANSAGGRTDECRGRGHWNKALIRSTGLGSDDQNDRDKKIITKVAETYLKSKAEVRNGQELVRDVGDIIKFTRSSMLGQAGCRHGEMTGEVGQVCCREELNRIGTWIRWRGFNLLEDRSIVFTIRNQYVVQDGSQLVDLTWNRHVACFDCHWGIIC